MLIVKYCFPFCQLKNPPGLSIRPGNSGVSWYLVPRIYLSLQNIFKEFSELGPLLNILLSRFKFLQIFFDISADLTVYSADMPIFSADLLIISAKFS